MSGTAVLLECKALAGEDEVLAAFQAARDDEYEEIVDRAKDFLVQVAKEHASDHFTFAELEENEVDLVKLQNWCSKVQARDVFKSPGRREAEEALAACAASLEEYANQVYARDADAH